MRIAELGGHFQTSLPQISWQDWFLGRTSDELTGVSFLGPDVSDREIDEIGELMASLDDMKRITFVETAVTERGRQRLGAKLRGVEISLITPVLEGTKSR